MNLGKCVDIKNTTIIFSMVLLLFSGQLQAASGVWHPLQPGLAPAQPNVELLEESNNHITVRMNLSGIYIDEITVEKEAYQRLHYGYVGDASRSMEGEPLLPMITEIIRIPDKTSADVSIIKTDWQYMGDFNLFPRQLPHRDDGLPQKPFVKLEAAYSSKSTIPIENVRIGRMQGWGGVAVAPLSITPLRYVASTQKLEIASSITIRIDFHPSNQHNIVRPHSISARMNKLHQISILNPQLVVDQPFDADENEPVRMLVIVREEALETAQPLIDFHHERGLRTDVWIADDIEDEEEIKERVIEMYDDGLEYLFIVGDAYTRNNDSVPIHHWDAYDPGWQDEENTASHSDNWYVCLDEAIEEGNNLIEDHIPELSVGRLVYDRGDVDELDVQISKIMSYLNWEWEEDNDGEWLSRSIHLAHRENHHQDGIHYIECKREIAEYQYEMPSPEFVMFYGNEDNAINENVINAINNDGFIIFNYRGHGAATNWADWSFRRERWDDDEVNQLENINSPFVLISSACWTGNIAEHGGDCLTESFQKHGAGGSMCAHGSIISTYTDGNHFFDKALFRAWFDNDINDIGYASTAAMTEMVNNWADDRYSCIGRMNLRAYAWQGDPALEIRLTPPQEMEIDIPELANLGTDLINANISIDDEPLEGATICARGNDDDIYVVGASDEDGRLTLVFDPPLDEAVRLSWTAYHRLGLPASGVVMVLDSVGSVEGTVTSLATEEPIGNALIQIPAFDLETQTNDEGFYTFRNIPASEHIIEVSALGYLGDTTEVVIIEDSTHAVDFELRNSVFEADSLEITQHLDENESQQRDFVFSNSGNCELIWSTEMEYGQEYDEYEVINEFNFGDVTGDNKINGVEYIDGNFYITGSNGNADPNYLYVVNDSSGEMIHRYNQPEGCGGVGIQDLAFDGENLYGGCNGSIFVIDHEGELVRSFEGPYNPNSSLSFDDEDNLWVGSNNQALLKINTDGEVLDTIPNELAVNALAWFHNADDGYRLLMFVRDFEENQVLLYRANPETNDVRLVTNLTTPEENIITGSGLTVSGNYNPLGWTLMGTVIDGNERVVKAWHLSNKHDWLSFNPVSGRVWPQEDGMISFIFTAPENSDRLSFQANLRIETNAIEPVFEIPILLEVGINDVIDEQKNYQPTTFTLRKAYPNPFNARTVIPVELPATGKLEAGIYDISGRLILNLASGKHSAGVHELVFSADGFASGVYLLRVEYNGDHAVQKVVLLR